MSASRLAHALVAAAFGVLATGAAADTIERSLRVGGEERVYEIDLPAPGTPARPLPA